MNYDVPQHPEDYVHRIGRTGRALQVGDAVTIFTAEEIDHVRSIERFIGTAIKRVKLDGFNYLFTALFNEAAIPQGGVGKGVRTAKGYSFGARKRRVGQNVILSGVPLGFASGTESKGPLTISSGRRRWVRCASLHPPPPHTDKLEVLRLRFAKPPLRSG